MSAIHDLSARISAPRLHERLAAEWANVAKEKNCLYCAKPRKGDLVCRQPGLIKHVWQVKVRRAIG